MLNTEYRGHDVGWMEFLASNKYKELIAKHHFEGPIEFKKPSTYESNIVGKTKKFLMQGFDLCIAQANHLGAFKPNVDCSKMSSFVDATLNPPVKEPEGDASSHTPIIDDEFFLS